jgi:hypothetical protein
LSCTARERGGCTPRNGLEIEAVLFSGRSLFTPANMLYLDERGLASAA